ncbi:hypothetical protein B4926_18440 [Vibrio cholerae]|nr:hypothetical protein [Vibrio cholerae]MCD1253403.1 hypothetical protein [Vibrio cholerae]MVB62791.1 hypothetical protein [Vibrio cholerae]MVC50584.1 hypothetical protein [Vibrio cholerae]
MFALFPVLRTTIPFLLEAAPVLATFVHSSHTVCLCSWGFIYLPPTYNSKSFMYNILCVSIMECYVVPH